MAHILIVEDDLSINELIAKNLKLVGHTYIQAYDGIEAVNAASENAFDLVLLDVMLPGIDGFEVIKKIPPTPVIFITARDGLEHRLNGLSLGADGNYVLDEDGYILMEDYREVEGPTYSFYFMLDGITGERISIHRDQLIEIRMIDPNRHTTPRTQEEYDAENERLRVMSGQFQSLVEEYAQKHFNNTSVVSVVYELGFSRFDGIPQLQFTAIDETGREASITFDVNSKQLVGLCTQSNDIVPGFDFGWTIDITTS